MVTKLPARGGDHYKVALIRTLGTGTVGCAGVSVAYEQDYSCTCIYLTNADVIVTRYMHVNMIGMCFSNNDGGQLVFILAIRNRSKC